MLILGNEGSEMDLERLAIAIMIGLSTWGWVLSALSHIRTHHVGDFDHVSVIEDFRKQHERTENNIFNLAKRLRQLEDLVGKEDV